MQLPLTFQVQRSRVCLKYAVLGARHGETGAATQLKGLCEEVAGQKWCPLIAVPGARHGSEHWVTLLVSPHPLLNRIDTISNAQYEHTSSFAGSWRPSWSIEAPGGGNVQDHRIQAS